MQAGSDRLGEFGLFAGPDRLPLSRIAEERSDLVDRPVERIGVSALRGTFRAGGSLGRFRLRRGFGLGPYIGSRTLGTGDSRQDAENECPRERRRAAPG
jgi:hypothetical protein